MMVCLVSSSCVVTIVHFNFSFSNDITIICGNWEKEFLGGTDRRYNRMFNPACTHALAFVHMVKKLTLWCSCYCGRTVHSNTKWIIKYPGIFPALSEPLCCQAVYCYSSVITTNQFYSVTICLSTLSGVFTSIMFLTAAVTALFFISVEL